MPVSGMEAASEPARGPVSAQVVVLLLLGTVVVQQLRGSERVGHRDRRGGGRAAARDLREHARVRIGGELEPAVALRDDHREEAARLEELPHLRRQIGPLVRDVPLIEHAAQLLARAVEERLLGRRELRRSRREQLFPLRSAGEQLPVPPHRARLERFLLGLRHARQELQVSLHERPRDERLAQRPHVQQPQPREQHPQEALPQSGWRTARTEPGVGGEQCREGRRESEQRETAVGEKQHRRHEQQRDDTADLRQCVRGRQDDDQRYDGTQHRGSLRAARLAATIAPRRAPQEIALGGPAGHHGSAGRDVFGTPRAGRGLLSRAGSSPRRAPHAARHESPPGAGG